MFFELSTGKGDKAIAEIIDPDKDALYEALPDKEKKKHKRQRNYLYINEFDTPKADALSVVKLTGKEILVPVMPRQSGDHSNRIFLAGGTLCGKSYLAGKIAKDYNRNFKKNKVVNFSWVDDDKAYSKLKNYHKIRVDESILTDPIDLDELKDSICIFDDIEHFPDKNIRGEVERLRDSSFNAGSHNNNDVL